jgi:hypothetical protein
MPRDSKALRIEDALEQLEQTRPDLTERGYQERRDAILEARNEPAAPWEVLLDWALRDL